MQTAPEIKIRAKPGPKPREVTKSVKVTIRLDPAQADVLRTIARRECRSPSAQAEFALAGYLNQNWTAAA
jgi:hypothetical protein